jgi:ketose-bisphosphate aldolase
MPLETVSAILKRAALGKYAVGYFESWNIESLQGVVDAAEETRSPVILGFNGGFLSSSRPFAERLALYAAVGRAAAESSSVPCGLIFNECQSDEWVMTAIAAGFNLVMPSDPAAPAHEYTARVAAITAAAHSRGVAVEAELGELPHGAATGEAAPHGGSTTDPRAAAQFVAATGIDLLAVSVGNVHVQTEGQRGLDLSLLEEIHRRVTIPLVLHGGSGINAYALRAAITLGVAKVNFGTYLKERYLRAVRSALSHDEPDPHRLLGMGGPEDVLVAGRRAVREAVLERIDLLGCPGRAPACGPGRSGARALNASPGETSIGQRS